MITGINELYHLKQTNREKALESVCKEFESMFAHQLMKVMGEAMPDGLFEDNLASGIYKDMLYQSVAQSIAESGALGIGALLKNHMQHLAETGEASDPAKQNR